MPTWRSRSPSTSSVPRDDLTSYLLAAESTVSR